ncbi:MAG: DUF4920 domain-containing protein [Bacteroidetes bacterium]|nr:DUF4920 domain-containing protein [Bacteroidota bacterium]
MKTRFFALSLFLLISASVFAQSAKKYGKEITLKDKTKISSILDKPEDFVGKKVLVEGLIVNVCENRGCWMELAGDKPYTKIKIKVKDGEIVFPMTEKGKKALVEGEVYKITWTKEERMEAAKEEAEEKGTKPDFTGLTDSTWYQIKGLGAKINE